MSNNDVIIYTDGSSRGNPGPGGYGIVMEDCKTGFSKQYSKGFQNTTNNRMELMAVIEALKKLKKTPALDIKNTRIRVPNYKKIELLTRSYVKYQLNLL